MTDPTPRLSSAGDPEASAAAAAPEPKAGVGITIAKNSFWLLTDSIVGMLASFYCSIMVARGLGPDRMGEYNYLIYFAAVLKMVTELAIPATFRKFAAEIMGRGDYATLKTMVRVALRLQAKLAAIGLAVGLAVVYLTFRPEQRGLATLAVLTIVPGIFLSVPSGALWATENLSYNVMASVSAMAVNAVGVTLSVVLRWGLTGLVASMLVSRTVDCSLRFLLFRWRYARVPGTAREHLDPDLRRRMVAFATLQLVLVLLYSLLFDRMEVLFLKALATPREIAFFSISFTVAAYLLIVPQTLAGSASVSMMVKQGHAPEESARIAAMTTWFTILLAAPMVFGVAALSDPLLRLAYGVKYVPAIPVLTTLALFALGQAASQPTQYLLVSAERQGFYLFWLLVAGAIDVVGNLLLIPRLGALGAALAKGVSQIIGATGFLVVLTWHFRARLPVARIVKVLAAAAVMFFAVRLVARPLGSLPALLLGIPVGAAVFVLLLRVLRCLDAGDRERLRQLARFFPRPARRGYVAILRFLAPPVTGTAS
jgi:O-antigen/teichoic acid export membrane protein